MSFIEDFPHTSIYDKDLGMLIRQYKELNDKYEVLKDIYEIVKKQIDDITIEQLEKWLNDGTLSNIINNELLGDINNKLDANIVETTKNTESIEHINNDIIDINNKIIDIIKKLNDNNIIHQNFKCSFVGGTTESPVGNCMIVQYKDINIIIEVGQDEGLTALYNALNKLNIRKIDYIVITHYHDDHVGENGSGIINLLSNRNYDTSTVTMLLPHANIEWNNMIGDFNVVKQAEQNIYNYITNHNIKYKYPKENEIIKIDNLEMKFNNLSLSYFNGYYTDKQDYRGVDIGTTNYNNFSMIVSFVLNYRKFLVTGDISYQAQVNNYREFINVDVLQIPHHALERECDKLILNNIKPKIGVICGSTFYTALNMDTPIVTQIGTMGGLLHYTTNNPILTVDCNVSDIEISPTNVQMYNSPSRAMSLGGGTPIPLVDDGTFPLDFNEYKIPGEYYIQNVSVLDRMTNKPSLRSGGKLIVLKTTQSNSIRQFYISSTLVSNVIATRYFDQTSWGAWYYITAQSAPV